MGRTQSCIKLFTGLKPKCSSLFQVYLHCKSAPLPANKWIGLICSYIVKKLFSNSMGSRLNDGWSMFSFVNVKWYRTLWLISSWYLCHQDVSAGVWMQMKDGSMTDVINRDGSGGWGMAWHVTIGLQNQLSHRRFRQLRLSPQAEMCTQPNSATAES